tara:strand:+ start:6993 stop:8519 length:1527 start_codon:yes stop_codon:yes gene_type:complete
MQAIESKNILFLFAPTFVEFGCDLVTKLREENPDILLTAFCMGGIKTVRYIERNIPKEIITRIIDYEYEEKKWFNKEPIDLDYISSFTKHFGDDFFNLAIIADRRLGKAYVSGGLVRPNTLADLSIKFPGDFQYRYMQGALKFLDTLFKEISFDLVFLYATAGAPAVMLSFYANFHKVNLRRFQHTRIQDRIHLDASYKGSLSLIKEKFNCKDSLYSKEAIEKAKKYLDRFRKNPETPEYSKFNHKIKSRPLREFIVYILYFFAYNFRFFLPKTKRDILTIDKLRHKWFYFNRNLSSKFTSNTFYNKIPKGKYVYFPLHVDPEASTMVLSPYFTNQLAIIENIAKSLPTDYDLIVKEHIPMVGFRPKNFYQKIKSFPRVKLIHPGFDQFTLIKNSSIVSVVTGTAGLEALMLGKKVLIFEKETPFACIEKGLIVESDLSKLNKRIIELEKINPPDDERLIKYLGLIFQETFSMNSNFLWGNYNKYSIEEKKEVLNKITNQLSPLISQD